MTVIPPGRRGVLFGAAGAATYPGPGTAPSAMQPVNAAAVQRANAGTVGIVSGGVEGTYVRIAADLAAVLDDGDRLRVLPVIGKGSVQNVSDIVYLRGIDIGIVQSDVLAYALRENMFPGIGQALHYIAKLYDEEIHVLARRDIAGIEALRGQKVNVDVRGSGTAMTAALVFNTLQIPIQPQHDVQSNALRRLLDGEIAALVYVAGKPASLFAPLQTEHRLHFLPLPASAELLDTYLPSSLTGETYPGLMADAAPVDTLAVGAVMAVYGWPTGSERYRKVARFVAALSQNFAQLQRPPRHPKWREVNLSARVPGWTRWAGVT